MSIRQATRQEIETAYAAGQPLPLFPLALSMEGCFTEKQMNTNFFATLDRGYTPINGYLDSCQGTCSIVGAGPSIAETYTDLVGDVLAINSAIGYLLDKSIVPRWAMIWDCDPVCENFAVPHPDITYLIASRCHPKVFERLKDCKIIVWHAAGDLNIVELMNRPDIIARQSCHEPLINGGTAGVTRGIYVTTALGYRDLHLFGSDSSYSDDGRTHVIRSLVPEKDITIAIGNAPPAYFRTTPEWCSQVMEYRMIYTIMACGCGVTIDVHGSGMLKSMHDLLVAKRALEGDEKFIANMQAQEHQRQAMDKAASEAVGEPANV